jgi:serine/threonine protein kinase
MKKATARDTQREAQPQTTLQLEPGRIPDFLALLHAPIVEDKLPSDFQQNLEAAHLAQLWSEIRDFQEYDFEQFVHAGGSGMVFKVVRRSSGTVQALKVARAKLCKANELPEGAASALSPVSQRELRALEKLSHPNVVHLYEAIADERARVLAIATTYIDKPQSLDGYLSATLGRLPKNVAAFSPKRLNGACEFLLLRCLEIAEALAHMHAEGIYHFDIKPANILISSKDRAARRAVLTDLGACVHVDELRNNSSLRVNFTWTYAHPDLTTMKHLPESISGGGLKASAEVNPSAEFAKYDLFSFGRTLQEALAILESEFGERSHAAYGFRFLHIVASLLLDGQNSPSPDGQRVQERHGRRFVSDTALDYPTALFASHRIKTCQELVDRLKRFSREYSWYAAIPELDPWQPNLVNTGVGEPAPFTDRVARVLGHPVMRRLKWEAQLGWMREVFPGATHNRWSHTIGVFAATVKYYNSLLADPETPTLRILLNREDLSHAMIAALLHDVGQVAFGHDLEAACPYLYNHNDIVLRLLDETCFGSTRLRDVIGEAWPEINLNRALDILSKDVHERPIDGIAKDIIDGPIDADKLDYLRRDSLGCGVAYGSGIDTLRFLQALSVHAKPAANRSSRLVLAYKSKGTAAIEAVLLARYQMYSAIYWHHSFRCIQAMFTHAAVATFGSLTDKKSRRKLRRTQVTGELITNLIYSYVVCGLSISVIRDQFASMSKLLPAEFQDEPPSIFEGERALEFVWKFADDRHRALLEQLGRRQLFKRVFELKVLDLGGIVEYEKLKGDLEVSKRPQLAGQIQVSLITAINKAMQDKGPRETITEDAARERYQILRATADPLIVIDFPARGVPDEHNVPPEVGDASRKYTASTSSPSIPDGRAFQGIRKMLASRATFRVFAADQLHELIVRYLDSSTVEACIGDVLPGLKRPS